MSNDYYLHNPLIHRERRCGRSASAWVRQFDCSHLRPLIICRGPIRKEAMDVFAEMGIGNYGILLSEKDSIVYRNALAPELRQLTDSNRVHRVPDYSGDNREERVQRICQIIGIARDNGYNAVFAGYGFMAEDEALVAAVEQSGLNFIGPCSRTLHCAGLKDEARRTARAVGVSVTPGIDNATALTLLKKYADTAALQALCVEQGLTVAAQQLADSELPLADQAEQVLAAAGAQGIDLYSTDELCATLTEQTEKMAAAWPGRRIRLKAIGGGGGKGQRILAADEVQHTSERVREILNEVKATGVGDNKNVLIELNIETSRHQEIQLIGNGDWAIALGGRDCSLQMHEQKLLEVSVTQESLKRELDVAHEVGQSTQFETLTRELLSLRAMEAEAERFAAAVNLDSVSTFECIVDSDRHFFMEMNTRIQVEHRVTELCYALRFDNPEQADDGFVVESLVEAMVLLAVHAGQLPRPQRLLRHKDAVEVRLNATNQALQPHAGGIIEHWSDAGEGEIRDDQGISLHNPDTGVFMKYALSGAYDSNIALLLTVGDSRLKSYKRMAELLRCTSLRGRDLATNLEFHYGLINWLIGQNSQARPSTAFIAPYLTALGELAELAGKIDLVYAYEQLMQSALAAVGFPAKQKAKQKAKQDIEDAAADCRQAFERKYSLLRRPLQRLLQQAHLLSGWLSVNRDCYTLIDGKICWNENPLQLLAETYHFLHMNYRPGQPAAHMIWDHDRELLQAGLDFYRELQQRLSVQDWIALQTVLERRQTPSGFDAALWAATRAAHAGYQAGLDILALLPAIAEHSGYFELCVQLDLSITIPARLTEPQRQQDMARLLAPPPVAGSDEILALSGGMFYARESPQHEPYLAEGRHFNAGDPLYIVEVMKMFNKVYAPFAGTVDKVLVAEDGVIISKGQPLFKITPDELPKLTTPEQLQQQRRATTRQFLQFFAPPVPGSGP